MERWLLYLHLAAVLGFMLIHGASVQVTWKMRGEPDPERSLHLFDPLSDVRPLRLVLGAVIVTGLVSGYVGAYWREWWMWAALVLLLAITWLMRLYGGGFYTLIERAATEAIEARGSAREAEARSAFDRVRRAWHPVGLTIVGLGGLAVILWLMVFKPF